MASPSTKYEISKFNGRNYSLWKHLLKDILESEGLYAVVFDNTLNPSTDDEKEEWLAADKEAKEIILSYLDPKHIRLVQDCQHSKDIIDKLDTTYGQKNFIQKMCAEEKLNAYRMRSSDTIAEHLAKVEELAQEVRNAGGEMSEFMVMAKILGSLSRKFHDVRETWLSPSKENDTLEDLKAGLLKEEQIILEKERLRRATRERRHHSHHRTPYDSHHHGHRRPHSSKRPHTPEDQNSSD